VVAESVGTTLNAMEFTVDGKMVVIGDSKGQVHIYELGEVGKYPYHTNVTFVLLTELISTIIRRSS